MAERVHIARFGPGSACSAGIAAFPGQVANELAVKALQASGIDPGDHCARALDEESMRQASAVIAMTAAHRAALIRTYPYYSEKIHTLKENIDIDDPFGFAQPEYDACLALLLELISTLVYNS